MAVSTIIIPLKKKKKKTEAKDMARQVSEAEVKPRQF